MVYTANLFDLAKLVVKAEQEGGNFYRRLSQQQKSENIKKILLFFAEEEKEHAKVFNGIANEIKNGKAQQNFSIDVMTMIKEGISKIKSGKGLEDYVNNNELNTKDCLKIALTVEQETAKIYQAIQNAFGGKYNTMIYKIIAEERKHAEMIQNVIQSVEKK